MNLEDEANKISWEKWHTESGEFAITVNIPYNG